MRRPPRLLLAALVGVVTGGAAWIGARTVVVQVSCASPRAWIPDWAWPCLDDTARAVRDAAAIGWDTALPIMVGAAVFLAVGLTGRR
jgi:hypothetical protein